MAKLSEPLLIEYQFEFGARRRAASARLGFPRPSATHKGLWECSFQLHGVKDSRIHRSRGVDGMQALTKAASAIRKSLARLKVVESSAVPYEFIFPKTLPISYGLEFHRALCTLVDAEIGKKERQLSRRRLAREKKSR